MLLNTKLEPYLWIAISITAFMEIYVKKTSQLKQRKNKVLRIRDVYPGSEFFPSRIPDSGSKRFRIPGFKLSEIPA
jgi:hypothetical protein